MDVRAFDQCLHTHLLCIGGLRERGAEFVQDTLKNEALKPTSDWAWTVAKEPPEECIRSKRDDPQGFKPMQHGPCSHDLPKD